MYNNLYKYKSSNIVLVIFFFFWVIPQITQAATMTQIGHTEGDFVASFKITVPAGGVATGHGIIIFAWGDTNAATSVSVSDSRGNTYQQDAFISNVSNHFVGAILSGYVNNPLQSGDLIIIAPSTQGHWHAVAYDLSTMASSNWIDKTSTKFNSNTNTPDTGTTGLTTQNNEVVFAGFVNTASFLTYGSGYTGLDSFTGVGGGRNGVTEWKEVSNTGTQSASATYTGVGVDTLALVVSYKEGADTLPPDTTAPILSSINSSSITQNSASITWNTDENSDTQVEYGPTASYGISTTLNSVPVTSHSINLIGLNPNTLYHYRVKSRDSAGNLTISTDQTFTTTATQLVDTTAPSVPINLSATAISSSQINLSWTASTDNVGVTGYRIYRGGTQIGTSATNSYSNTGLTPSTQYSYTVSAYDATSNVSSQSSSASATTQTATPPLSGNIREVGPGQTYTTIQSCLNAVQPGEICNVHAGVYNEQLSFPRSGTSDNVITLRANPGDVVNVQTASSPVLNISGRSYWTISDVNFTYNGSGSNPAVIQHLYGAGNINYITIANSTITLSSGSGNGFGIYIASSDHLTVTGTTVNILASTGSHDGANILFASNLEFSGNTIFGNASESTGKLEDGLVVSGTNLNIENNILRDGWSYDNHPDGIVVQGDGDRNGNNTSNVKVWRNTVYNFTQGIYFDAIHNPLSGNNLIANNVIYETSNFRYGGSANKMNCLVIDGENISGNPTYVIAANIYNNTFNCKQLHVYHSRTVAGSSLNYRNNIFLAPSYTAIYLPNNAGTSMDYDYLGSGGDSNPVRWGGNVYSWANFKNVTGQESHSVIGNVNLNTDYTEKSTSDSINRGLNLSSSFITDRIGIARPVTGSWDIGAYEYSGSTPPPPPPPPTYAVGDFNQDGLVNSIDFSLMITAWNTSNATYDLNHDSAVNSLDYAIMVQNWSI